MDEDCPKSIVYNINKLLPVFTKVKRILWKRDVSLSKDRLTVCGEHYSVKSLNNLKEELNVRSFTRREDIETLVFRGILSIQFPVTHENMTYPILEHGFMHIKCVMNNDVTFTRAILHSPEPYMANQIGDKVKINKDILDIKKSEEVMSGLLQAKLFSGSNLARELVETGKSISQSLDGIITMSVACRSHIRIFWTDHHIHNRLSELLMDIRPTLRPNV